MPKDINAPIDEMESIAYDIVLNGVELGGGSMRIHKKEIQERVFDILKISKEEAKKKFGFLLEAFEYGAPPHGGFAIGIERLVMKMLNLSNIKEAALFPRDPERVLP